MPSEKAVNQALEPIKRNAETEAEMGARWIEMSHDRNLPEGFRHTLLDLGTKLSHGNITLSEAADQIVSARNALTQAQKDLKNAVKKLPKTVEKNAKEDLGIAGELDTLLDAYHEQMAEEILDVLEADLQTLRDEEERTDFIQAPKKLQAVFANEMRHPVKRLLWMAATGAALTQGGALLEKHTGQTPIEWVGSGVEWVIDR